MIYRIYATKDSYITDDVRPNTAVRMTGSNFGASEELQVYKRSGVSGVLGTMSASFLARALVQFDMAGFMAATGTFGLPSQGYTATLRLSHKSHGDTQPTSYDMFVGRVTTQWDEGVGHDVVDMLDSGYVNWVNAQRSTPWTTPGGDYVPVPGATVHFDTGIENLEADVTTAVTGWCAGLPNYGVLVKMADAIESDSVFSDYYVKKFYTRQTNYPDRAPYIEVRANDFRADDRSNMQFGRSGTLCMYNLVGGQYSDLPESNLYVSISDASGVLLQLTASHDHTGLYSASFLLPSGTYSGSVFYDSWGSGSFAVFTGSFSFNPSGPYAQVPQPYVHATLPNLQDEYPPEDAPIFQVNFRRRGHTLPVVQTGSTFIPPTVAEQAYYAIENDSTRERVIPFGTGTLQHTRLSYDGSGNYFRFFMSNLQQGEVYRLIFLVVDSGRRQVIDSGFKFKVT